MSPRIAGVPYFYWPSFSGDSDRFPLRDVRFENSSENGFAVKTRWDMLGILGIDAPGWTADLLLDGWFKRGVGVGADIAWKEPGIEGNPLAYMVPDDRGTDVLPSGVKRDRDTGNIVSNIQLLITFFFATIILSRSIPQTNSTI